MARTALAASTAISDKSCYCVVIGFCLAQQLAALYGVQTRVLMHAVQRNRDRFPADFMSELDQQELEKLKSQFVTSSWGGLRKPPKVIFDAIRELMEPPTPPKKRRIGFS